jgi:hypothetical protein
MTDILPGARQEIVPGQAMSPVWFNALRLMARSIKQGASGIVDVQAQLAPVLAALRTTTGEIINIADALAGKLDATTSMKTLAKLTGSGFVRKHRNTWSASDPLASEISYDPAASGLAAEDVQAALDEVAAAAASGVPYEVADGDTYSVPAGVQALWEVPIELLGASSLDISGALVEVS